jgi:hypothetical protein
MYFYCSTYHIPSQMYLALKQKCPMGLFFDMPHRPEPMTAKQIIKKFPKFAQIFDGEGEENTLKFYYKKSKETGIYEFIDFDAEEEVADLMGVKIKEFTVKNEEDLDDEEKRPLDSEDIEKFKSHMADIRTGIMWLKNQSKNSETSTESSSDSQTSSDSD